jgi:hypothetical protein
MWIVKQERVSVPPGAMEGLLVTGWSFMGLTWRETGSRETHAMTKATAKLCSMTLQPPRYRCSPKSVKPRIQ